VGSYPGELPSVLMARVFSGIQPSGNPHLGNLLGAMVNYVKLQDQHDAVYCIVDLHAITVQQDPAQLRQATIDLSMTLMAAGLDPERCILFAQSQVPAHNECGWIAECTVSFGELSRMTQFKDKSGRQKDFISAALFTYPALQAADILLYDTDLVPVGDDQRQHIELSRDIAARFNSRYATEEKPVFVVPEHVIPKTGARIMDLKFPDNKMSKSMDESSGTVLLMDDLKTIEKKFKRATTDSETDVRYDPENKPGVSNLLSILAAATDADPETVGNEFEQYGHLKLAAAEAVIELIRPMQERFNELSNDPAETMRLLKVGGDKANEIASATLERARDAIGLLPR